ncbi:lysophospholipid acyltransferase family protein [Burkholderia singularis]|uniref:2-acylglycerophosphoethanolamine acyltransferase / Acyl-[acyl-carrier-protein] synthetase n=1 Tax=Burkholderia singularis TaxID=1503053 RepID=A0A238H7D9_9BURK|nr:lysophospholipid acyltransferase family protein [Burkholderia singularis]SMG01168.1 2-acylglycerophosphoethanolamine acyltransferase / Acyl-[acyl-carrier-protein] synthetase [Burkholderia singularis]
MKSTFILTRWLSLAGLRLFRTRVSLSDETVARLKASPHIVCANHVSYHDGLLVAFASPVRLVFCIDTLHSRRLRRTRWALLLGQALGLGRMVSVDSGSPYGMRRLLRELKNGNSVMVFPEGRISPDGNALVERPGVEWLAKQSGADIIRLHIDGAHRCRIFGKNGDKWFPPIRIEG